jgi:hypothetical protein
MNEQAQRLLTMIKQTEARTVVLFYTPPEGPVERHELVAIDAMHAIENHPSEWSTNPPGKGVAVVDKVQKPLVLKPELLGDPTRQA